MGLSKWPLIPPVTGTIALVHDQLKALYMLQLELADMEQPYTREERNAKQSEGPQFEGKLKSNRFRMVRREGYVQYFSPYIQGYIEATSRGSLVFYTMELSPGTNFLLVMAILIGFCSMCGFVYTGFWLYACGVVGILLVLYFIVQANFKREAESTKSIIESIWNES